jgi:hypothetical protein
MRGSMKLSRLSEEQAAYALRQVEVGAPVGDVCRQPGVSEATFYAWKKKYAHQGQLDRVDAEGRLVTRLLIPAPEPGNGAWMS